MLGLCVAAVPSEETDDSLTAASSRTEGPHGPSLFQEIDEAVNICTLTYTLTMLRRLFREGKISKDKARKASLYEYCKDVGGSRVLSISCFSAKY